MHSKMFRVFAGLALLTMTLSVCAAPAAPAPAAEAPAAQAPAAVPAVTEPVTLTIIIEQVPDYDIVAKLTPEFEAANPDIKIVWDAMPYDAMRDKILTSFLAPEGTYDIIIVDNPWMDEFPAAGFLTDITDYVNNTPNYNFEDFEAPIRDLTLQDGKIYAVPYLNYAVGLIVRQDLFDDPACRPSTRPSTASRWRYPRRWTNTCRWASSSRQMASPAPRCSRRRATRSWRSGRTGCMPRAAT